jgi:hypothetical protein
MANPNKSRLDASQCIVGAYDSVEESQRVSIVNSVEYAIELSAADGDSVKTFKDTIRVCNVSVSSDEGAPVTSVEVDSSTYSSFCVYTNINGNPAASGYVLVQGTCSDTGSNWHDISDPIYAGKRPPAATTSTEATAKRGSSGVVELSSRRVRLYIPVDGKPSSGTVEYSIVLRS